MPYVLTVDGAKFNTDDLTLDESIDIETETDSSWVLINPFRSARHFKAIARVAMKRAGRNDAEIASYLSALTVTEALDSVELVTEDDLPSIYEDGVPDPKAEDETPTGT